MKRYKSLLFQIGLLIFIIAIFLFILEQQKKFIAIDFSKHYRANKTVELSGFEEGEQWRGNYTHDSERVLEGKTSITLSSWYGAKNTITKERPAQLKSGYTKGYISLYIADENKLHAVDSFGLELSEASNNKIYELAHTLHVGWNRIPVVVPAWNSLSSISFSIGSKKGEIAELNLDRFWIENTSLYTSDIFNTTNQSLSLRTLGERTYLYSASSKEESFSLNTPSIIKKGTITISLIPEHTDTIKLALNSTTLELHGKKMNECTLSNGEGAHPTKLLKNTSGKDDLYVFLKAVAERGEVAYSLSNNGVDFELCGAVSSTQAKPVSLMLKGSYLIDSITAEY